MLLLVRTIVPPSADSISGRTTPLSRNTTPTGTKNNNTQYSKIGLSRMA